MSKKVLVMGGSYFVGKKIVDCLVKSNYEVYTLNRGTKLNDNPHVKLIQCDRTDEGLMKEKLSDQVFDIVIDVSGLKRSELEVLCQSLNLAKIEQFIFISSSAVYDIDNLSAPFNENNERKENSQWTFYGQNKIEAEDYLTEVFEGTATRLTHLRPPYIYGENNYAQRESFIFDHIANDKKIIVPNEGQTQLQFIYTEDLGNIILSLLKSELENINVYNVGNKQALTVNEWIAACERVAGKKADKVYFDYKKHKRHIREFFPFFDYDNVLDVSKVKKIHDDETDFEVGLKAAYDWYQTKKEKIAFKENVTRNEKQILKLINE